MTMLASIARFHFKETSRSIPTALPWTGTSDSSRLVSLRVGVDRKDIASASAHHHSRGLYTLRSRSPRGHKRQWRGFRSSAHRTDVDICTRARDCPSSSKPLLLRMSKPTTTTSATLRRASTKGGNSDRSADSKTSVDRKPRKVTTLSVASKKRRGKKITMVTAYDYPSAVHVDRAGSDIVLVGDSCAMVELGVETSQPITLDQMIHHCQAVKRGAPNRPLLVGDMPFGSYEFENVDVALKNAYRMVKEGGMDAVKFEGGTESRAKIVRHVVEGGVAVLGHVGLTPQAISVIGGFRAQGRTAARARSILDEALRLQDAGAFAVVLECIPANVATAITEALDIPTIGIGAGGGTSGQVLVFHDLLGMLSHPHHEEFVPKFCKKYASVGIHINDGLAQFKKEVEDGVFPGKDYSPYAMNEEEEAIFDDISKRPKKIDETESNLEATEESDELNLYGNNKSGD